MGCLRLRDVTLTDKEGVSLVGVVNELVRVGEKTLKEFLSRAEHRSLTFRGSEKREEDGDYYVSTKSVLCNW